MAKHSLNGESSGKPIDFNPGETDIKEETDILQKLSRYYREVLKHVSSSASRVLQNVATGQKYGLVADLGLLVKDIEDLNKQSIIIKKPAKKLGVKKFKESDEGNEEIEEDNDPEEPEITDDEVAWSAINKIWRTQENNPYERETVIGQYLFKATVNNKNLLAPLLIFQAQITYDPLNSSFTITKLSAKPDLNRSLIATLLPEDDLGPVRSQINEIYLEESEVDLALIKKIIELITNNIKDIKEIKISPKFTSLNEIPNINEEEFIVNSFVLINTPRTGSFVLDDLDLLAETSDDIADTPIGELLRVSFDEGVIHENNDQERSTNIPKQEIYYFPLKSNIQQQRICDNVMNSNLTVVWGPPGTGKSETISNLVCHLVANGKSVLVTSQQHKALEVVRDKLRKNVSLSSPNHPDLTIPLELALIRGEKESTLAEDIKNKLDALGAYTLGIGSFYEIESKLEGMRNALKDNKDKSLALMKRFSELKLNERERYRAPKDSPLKLQELRDYELLDSKESFPFEDQKTNAELIKQYVDLLIELGPNRENLLSIYSDKEDVLEKSVIKVNTTLSILTKTKEIIDSSQKSELDFVRELLHTYSKEEALIIVQNIRKIWMDLQRISYEQSLRNKKFVTYIQRLMKVPDQSYQLTQKVLDKLIEVESDIDSYDLMEAIDIESFSLNDVAGDLEILKKTKPHMLTNLLDAKAKQALFHSASLLNLKDDWRNKELICSQLEKIIKLLKAKHSLKKIKDDFDQRQFDLNYDKLNIRHLSQFIEDLKVTLSIGKLLKDSNVISSYKDLTDILSKHINLDNLDNSDELIGQYNELVDNVQDIKKLLNDQKIKVLSYTILTSRNITELHSAFSLKGRILENLYNYIKVNNKLMAMPNSKEKSRERVERKKYKLPEVFLRPDLIVEQYRLKRLYEGMVEEETTEAIDQSLKNLESKKKELIYNYLLNTRLKMLYEASKSRTANQNLVMLKTLLGRKKKTLNFLRKKDAIDFTQVLQYFPCWLASIDDIARYFPLEKGLFDYVIVDEGSQCSQTAIPHLFYRAKNAVIVGDEKQLPNANLRFLQKGIMEALLRKYRLTDHKKSQFMDCKEYSLLTFAQAATPPLPLVEHFRCDSTIIAWSNKHVYNNMMKIMSPIWEIRFNPPMEVRYVSGGAEDLESRINSVEAKVVLEELKRLTTDKSIEGLTIGVISPFRPQADLISEMIYKEIAPDTIKRFAIQSRTVDGFQGDERDIILYSMRFSPNSKPGSVHAIEHGVNEEGFKRMNVAFTRARRKAIIFTSQKPALFPGKYIKSFMEHALTVQETYQDPFKIKDDQFDSQFEEDVCRMLRGRGFIVITQFPCAGYKIDQVISDKEGRTLAIELDGDFKLDESGELPPEHYMRQATIERVTQWDIYRVTASKFYLDPEKIIDEIIYNLRNQPTRVERKFNQVDLVSKEFAIGLTTTGNSDKETDIDDVLDVVESNVEMKTIKVKKPKKEEIFNNQLAIPIIALDGVGSDKDLWFNLSHWGKVTGKLTSFQNRFCYTLGRYILLKNKLTEKQEDFGTKILQGAIRKGFTFKTLNKK